MLIRVVFLQRVVKKLLFGNKTTFECIHALKHSCISIGGRPEGITNDHHFDTPSDASFLELGVQVE